MKNPWPNCPPLPSHAAAVLGALHIDEANLEAVARLGDSEWRRALDYADRERITLALRNACRDEMPEWVRERVDRDAVKNQARLRGAAETYSRLAGWFADESLEYIFLKGLTHSCLFGLPPENRVQYDIDLWLPRDHAIRAQILLTARGYEFMPGTEDLPTDHLPALVVKTGWQWRGDFFDPEIPLPVELHVQFWNEQQERFAALGTENFRQRRTASPFAGKDLPTLHPADAVAYAALHVLRHVLTGNIRIFHVYELAAILQARSAADAFWAEWQNLHPPQLRMLQALAFRLAREWFGGAAAPLVEKEIAGLPAGPRAWFELFALSPAILSFRPNKDHVWLHRALLHSRRDRRHVTLQRIFPRTLPSASGDAFVADKDLLWKDWLRWRLHWISYMTKRALHHARALPAVAVSGVRWWWRTRG